MGAPVGARLGWKRRPVLATTLRVAATLVPVVVSVGVAFALNRAVPAASDTSIAILRSLGLAVCSLGALVATDALARRFLPLAALLQLSLVFPDRTPSRFKTALKGGSSRRLAREVDVARREGISDDPARAAEQLLMLATAMGDHDRRTRGHSERVRLYTELIAEELHLSVDERSKLQWAALLHDIGKIEVAPEILNKKGRPDADEWVVLQRHPLVGERLAAPVEPWLGDAVHAIGGHHERWDGSGYPRGLAGSDIPRAAAIVAVADAFEVMTAVRSYKPAMPLAEARAELTRCAGSHFSPEVVRALLSVSIGRLRRSMGLLAVLAHVPLLGPATKVAAYAPDTVSTAVGFTTSTATAGAGVLAVAGALAVASPAPISADAVPATTRPPISYGLQALPEMARPPVDTVQAVHVVDVETPVASTVAPANIEPPTTTTAPPAPSPATTVAADLLPTPDVAMAESSPLTTEPVTAPPSTAPTPESDQDDDGDGQGNSGMGNSGNGNSSNSGDSGNGNRGSGDSGNGNSGKGNSGKGNSGERHDDDDDDDDVD
jgi:HD-GYP domain-containing protein (c-di-GMP phosphodiesterase class II)